MKLENIFSSFKNQYGKTIGEIRLYSSIGEGWGEDGAVNFNEKLDEMRECDEIHVRINSGGGSVFSGNAIYASLKRFSKPVKIFIDGIAASIASVIMCAGETVYCPANAIIMLHRPLNQVTGNVDDMKENIAILEKVQETIEEAYLNKCGKKLTRNKLRDLLVGDFGDGTWLSAREAQALGLVDVIENECLAVAQYTGPSNIIINGTNIDLTNFKNTTKLKELIENKNVNKLEETNMSEISKTGISAMIDNIANSIKSSLGIKNEAEPETVEQTEEVVAQEENLEVQNEQAQEAPEVVETVAEETEAQEEIVEPSAEVTEEIEPSTETEPVAIVEPEAEIIVEAEQPAQEEPETDVVPEVTEEIVQNEPETTEEVIEATNEIEPSIEAEVIPEVNASIDLATELAKVKDELNKIKEADAQKAIALAKAELAKEVGNKFRGVPGKLEDKVELVYELKNSTLSDSSKEMILKSLENLSAQNLESCKELGHSEEIIVDELDELAKAKMLAKKEGISEGQALLVNSGKRTLAQAKAVKRK